MYIPYPEEVLKKLQMEELEVLKAFAHLCEKYDIKWFPTGGTLLGSVRHHGFIPWDDDIDVCLLKEDYEKFIKIPKEEYEKEYGFISPETGNGYYNFIPKFYCKDSEFTTSISAEGKCKKIGIFIEIFPVFYVSDNPKVRRKHHRTMRMLSIMLHETTLTRSINIVDPYKKVSVTKRIFRGMFRFFLRCLGVTSDKVNRWYVKWWNSVVSPDATCIMEQYCYPHDSEQYRFLPETLFPQREMMFEDMMVMVPNKAEDVLRGFYGEDFMQFPPPENRWNQALSFIRFSDGTEYCFTR